MENSRPQKALLAAARHHEETGDRPGAIAALRSGLDRSPASFEGWLHLARLLHDEGEYRDAIDAVRLAETIDPLQEQFTEIQRSMQAGDLARAERTAHEMLARLPGHPRAIFTLSHIAQARGLTERQIEVLESGLATSPANLVLRQLLVQALEAAGFFRRAIAAAGHLAMIDEGFGSLWLLMTILFRYGQNEDALDACARAEAHVEGDRAKQSEIDLIRGQIYRILGDREASIAAFREAIANKPAAAAAWWGLADMKTYRFTEDDQRQMARLLENPQADQDNKCLAAFALAKAREVEGDRDRSMAIYEAANRLYPNKSFDPEAFAKGAAALMRSFTQEALATRSRQQSTRGPIFIVGLPRSGSTLVEQILASHSLIEGTVESLVLPSVKQRLHAFCVESTGGSYLDMIGTLTAETLAAYGEAYLEESTLFQSGGSPLFTDKLPYNFEHVGLIHKLLPGAIIIDTRRNPLDCGLSIYRQYFARGSQFSYDLGHIGHYYRTYLSVMDHWDRVLPGKVLHVQYEELVRRPEEVTRAILAHVGVDFEEACLRFWDTRRPVRTASSEQVRQPLYTSGIGAWRPVDKHLGALKETLGPDVLSRFAAYLD